MGTPEGRTVDGFESQFGINHLGHFLLFQLLKSTLIESSTAELPSRVISLSSTGHRSAGIRFDDINFEKEGYDAMKAYGQSKTANIYFANEIERRYASRGLHATSVHPGVIRTGLQVHVPLEKQKLWDNPDIYKYFKSPEQGAATTVYAAISPDWANQGGKWLADCAEQGSAADEGKGFTLASNGYGEWAFDEVAEARLWKESLRMVGLKESD